MISGQPRAPTTPSTPPPNFVPAVLHFLVALNLLATEVMDRIEAELAELKDAKARNAWLGFRCSFSARAANLWQPQQNSGGSERDQRSDTTVMAGLYLIWSELVYGRIWAKGWAVWHRRVKEVTLKRRNAQSFWGEQSVIAHMILRRVRPGMSPKQIPVTLLGFCSRTAWRDTAARKLQSNVDPDY